MFQSSLQSRIGECGGSSNLGLCVFAARILIAGTSATFDKRHAQIKLARSHGIVSGSVRHGQNLIEFSCADIWPCFALPLDSRIMLFLLESLGKKQDVSNLENENCFASFDCVYEKM